MFKGMGNLGNIAAMVGSLKDLPDKMKDLNERMKSESVSASSGCGAVQVSMSGTGHVESVKIDGELSGHELEQAIQEATNAAGAAQGVRNELDTLVKTQVERVLGDLDVVQREEFEAVRTMAQKAREENETLNARVGELEAKLSAPAKAKKPAAKKPARKAAKKA